jgi:hypothetical protein
VELVRRWRQARDRENAASLWIGDHLEAWGPTSSDFKTANYDDPVPLGKSTFGRTPYEKREMRSDAAASAAAGYFLRHV